MTIFFGLGFVQQRLGIVASLQINDLSLARELLEVIKIERPVHRVQSENAPIAFAAVEDFDLK